MSSPVTINDNKRVLIAITGASGIRYALKLARVLSEMNLLEGIIYTKSAVLVAQHEEDIDLVKEISRYTNNIYEENDLGAPYASSSRAPQAMVIVPCSMNTLAKIAHGIQDNLVTRAALSMLRLRRRLVLVIRETPLGVAEIYNMLLSSLMGAIILPASPGFYSKPRDLEDITNFIAGKILDALGISNNLYRRWGSD